MKIIWTDNLGCPAAVSRTEGVMYLDRKEFSRLTDFEKKFVKLHEEGHYYLDTDDEVAADNYAFERLAGTEFRSLKKSLALLEKLLKSGNHTRAERLYNIYIKALEWDAKQGNESAQKELEQWRKTPPLNGAGGFNLFGIPIFSSYDTAKDKLSDAEANYNQALADELYLTAEAMARKAAAQTKEIAGQAKRNQQIMFASIAAVLVIVYLIYT